MARIRTLKPELLEDDKTANLSHLEWRLFVSAILLADDHGNLRAEVGYLQGAALWGSRDSREDVEKALARLSLGFPGSSRASSLLGFYSVRGQVYCHINGWERHQRVDKPGKPRMPLPTDPEAQPFQWPIEDSRDSRETSREFPGNPREVLARTLATDLRPPTSERDHEQEGDLAHARAHARAIPHTGAQYDTQQSADAPLPPEPHSADPEASRAHAIAPELEQQRVDSPGLAELKSKVNAATGDIGRRRAEQPRDLAQERRARLRVKTFDALGALRMQIASELKLQNVRPLHPHDGGERDLADRIVESGAQAEASCEHVLACAVQAARGGRTVKWLTGSLFGEKQWRRFLGTTPAEAFADAEREWRRLNHDAPIASTPTVNVSDDEDAARTRAELEAEHQKRLALAAKREAKERAARDAEQQKDPA